MLGPELVVGLGAALMRQLRANVALAQLLEKRAVKPFCFAEVCAVENCLQ